MKVIVSSQKNSLVLVVRFATETKILFPFTIIKTVKYFNETGIMDHNGKCNSKPEPHLSSVFRLWLA